MHSTGSHCGINHKWKFEHILILHELHVAHITQKVYHFFFDTGGALIRYDCIIAQDTN